jgi:hypothetical protein
MAKSVKEQELSFKIAEFSQPHNKERTNNKTVLSRSHRQNKKQSPTTPNQTITHI